MSSAPVLVVGAGPTGLTLACTLLRFGVACRIVDRRNGPGLEPKALILWSGALEALRRTGISDAVVEQALPLTAATYWARRRRIGRVRFGGLTDTAFPMPLCLPQPVTERLLHARLVELGGSVEWGVEADNATGGKEHVRAELRDSSGRTESVTTPWLVAADGTHSRMRSCLGIPFTGHTYERMFLLGDGLVDGPAPIDEAQYHLTPDGVLVVVPLPGGGHRVFFDVPPDDATAAPDGVLLQRLLDARGPGGLRLREVWWTSRFRVHTKAAARFRQGQAFLVGDAAHCHSPAGGQGLNTAVQDGYDLGWKLATVLRGADAALLDSYEPERRPASLRAIRNADQQTRLWLLRSPAARALRDLTMRQLSRWRVLERRLVPQLAQLDLDHTNSPAVTDLAGATTAPASAQPGRRLPDTPLSPVHRTTDTSLHDYLAAGRHTILIAGNAGGRLAADAQNTLAARGVTDAVDVLWLQPDSGTADRTPIEPDAAYAVARENAHRLTTDKTWLACIRPDGVLAVRAGTTALAHLLDQVPSLAAAHTKG